MKKMVVKFEVELNDPVGASYDQISNMLHNAGYKVRNYRVDFVDGNSWKKEFEKVFLSFGVTPEYKGYEVFFYMMEYVALYHKEGDKLRMKELYNYAIEKTGSTYERVERNIRSRINGIIDNHTTAYINEVLELSYDSTKYIKFTNKKFTKLLIRKLFPEIKI